jgi:diacylglycerol kinase family enzyme
MAASEIAGRAERLAERLLPARTPKKRMLVIVNPYASTVSERLKNLVVYALQSRYAVQAVETERRDHAIQLTREAAAEGLDVVVAFGGDGTVNEAANGLVGSATPLTCLPGGSTNVWCRSLGIPNDVVDATEHLLALADEFTPFPVDLGRANDRHFVFSSGVGLDASVVKRVDAHPSRKARFGPWYYTACALGTFGRRYLRRPPRMVVRTGGEELPAVTAVFSNSDPYTYFASRPIRVGEDAGLDTGTLSLTALRRATLLELPTLVPRLLSGRASTVVRHRQVTGMPGIREARVETTDGRPLPLQVDGDYIGDFESVEYRAVPRGLRAVA